jgi:outer membrane protein TolC
MGKMLPKLKNTILLFCLIVSYYNSVAQESMLTDVSYLYMEKLIASAKENYPRVKQFNSQVNAAKNDLSGAKVSWLDPFSFQYVSRSNQANTNAVDVSTADILSGYQFGVSINPGTLLAKPSQIKRAKEQVKIAQFNEDEYALQLEAEVKTRYLLYLQYKTSLAPVTRAYLDAESNFNSLKIKYQRAEITFQEYNTASMAFNQANQAKIISETNVLTAKVALEELTVKKLEQIK